MSDLWRDGEPPITQSRGFSPQALVNGIALAVAVTILCTFLISLLAALTSWDGASRSIYSFAYISVAAGGLVAGRRAGRIGWLHGAIVGIVYMLLILLFSGRAAVALLGFSGLLVRLLAAFATGAVGGMLGVNAL